MFSFTGPRCPACKTIKPILEKIAEEEGLDLEFLDVEDPENRDKVKIYRVQSLPTTVVIKNGKTISFNGSLGEDRIRKLIGAL